MNLEALGNALLYALSGLAIFLLVARAVRGASPATEMPEAIVRAAVILGTAIIVAHTMH